jgi:formylmethanofuran dehydrogenase subunit E
MVEIEMTRARSDDDDEAAGGLAAAGEGTAGGPDGTPGGDATAGGHRTTGGHDGPDKGSGANRGAGLDTGSRSIVADPADPRLPALLAEVSSMHRHLCPRQVLGVRMGLRAATELGVTVPQTTKRLIAIVETDGCASDGVGVATNCWVGRRTLRVEDYGKVAVTIVDRASDTAVRVTPHPASRALGAALAPDADSSWHAMLLAYQRAADDALLSWAPVRLRVSAATLFSRAGRRVTCARCGEEVLNEREVSVDGAHVCRGCAGSAYYEVV